MATSDKALDSYYKMKPILYIMCGLPFSGKTYLSKKISEHFGIVRISYDELWKEINHKESRDPSWDELCTVAETRISGELKNGRSVVYDTLNDTIGNREKLRKVARNNGGEGVVIYADTPIDLIHSRRKENAASGDRHHVSEANFQKALDAFEAPTFEEVMFRRTPDQDTEIWLTDLARFVKWRSGMPQIIKDVGFDFSWDSKKVWALDEPLVDMDINELIWHFDIPFWEVKDTDDYNLTAWSVIKEPDNEAHSDHMKKVEAADLKYAIDIMENKGRWLILDGLHRLVKAYLGGAKTVKVRKIPRNRIAEISK